MWGLTMWLALGATVWLLVKPRLHEEQPMLSIVLHLTMALPFVALARLFLVNDTSVLHVAAFGGEDLPLKYRFAATWAARRAVIDVARVDVAGGVVVASTFARRA